MQCTTTRRGLLAGTAALGLATPARAQMPTSPVSLNVIDIAGNLQLSRPMFEAYQKAKPRAISRIAYNQAPAPELPAKIKAQQAAGRVDIDIVLTGLDGLAAGIDQKLWIPLLTDHAAALPKLADILLPPAVRLQGLAQNQGVIIAYYPSGPLLEYLPDKVKNPPTTAEGLLEWAKSNPKRFLYARPANSGPGRTFMMGLPYLLGDSAPMDPTKGWDKTWAYLAELGKYIEYYPTGTGATMKELGDGSRDMIVSTTGWDINPRVLGVVPKEARIGTLKGFHWISDAHFVCAPIGLPADKLAVVLDIVNFMLEPKTQAFNYDKGYFYPGPAVKGVTLDMAPQESRDAMAEFGRPEYDRLIADNPVELPLDAAPMVYAFRRWDEQVGAKVGK